MKTNETENRKIEISRNIKNKKCMMLKLEVRVSVIKMNIKYLNLQIKSEIHMQPHATTEYL